VSDTPAFEDAATSERDSQVEALLKEVARISDLPEEPGAAEESEPVPERIGDYKIIERLGQGGIGVVYRAREGRSGRDVALKIIQQRFAGSSEVAARFRRSVEIAATLEARNIVRIYDTSGLQSERPFHTMQLVAGGTLADPKRKRRFREPAQAAALMIKIARAVQSAHEEGVLHGDLKPSNILLDASDEPYVGDFIAKRVDDPAYDAEGTIPYLAPEQAAGEGARIWTDVYALGAIFYELLTGRRPIEARTIGELREIDRAAEAIRWRANLSSINIDLREICLAALAEDPLDRPASAAIFAESLQRVLEYKPRLFPPTPRLRRVKLWTRRHPMLAFGAALGLLLLISADVTMFLVARSEQRELRDQVLRTNSALASAQAQAVLAGLKRHSDYTLQAASLPAIRELLLGLPSARQEAPLQDVYERAGIFGPDSVFVVDTEGTLVARWPPTPTFSVGKNYSFRDYYQCAKALARITAREVCICPAYRTEANDTIQFAFSSPVYDAGGKWLGALTLSRSATRTLGEIDFNDRYQSAQRTSVLGGRGPDRTRAANRTALTVLVHPDLMGANEFTIEPRLSERLITTLSLRTSGGYVAPNDSPPFAYDDYRDPLAKTPERMLASFAPVGQTGYVVAVSTPYRNASSPNQRLLDLLLTYGSVLNLSFVLVAAIAVWTSLRESPQPRRTS
jgi:serine/threonine-protein kinase